MIDNEDARGTERKPKGGLKSFLSWFGKQTPESGKDKTEEASAEQERKVPEAPPPSAPPPAARMQSGKTIWKCFGVNCWDSLQQTCRISLRYITVLP